MHPGPSCEMATWGPCFFTGIVYKVWETSVVPALGTQRTGSLLSSTHANRVWSPRHQSSRLPDGTHRSGLHVSHSCWLRPVLILLARICVLLVLHVKLHTSLHSIPELSPNLYPGHNAAPVKPTGHMNFGGFLRALALFSENFLKCFVVSPLWSLVSHEIILCSL